eukprot:g8548.t1
MITRSISTSIRGNLIRSAINSLDVSTMHGNPLSEENGTATEMAHTASHLISSPWVDGEEGVDESVDPFKIVSADVNKLNGNIKELLGSDHPVLETVAQYFFDSEGKKIRPTIVLLTSKAINPSGEVSSAQVRLAEITEMIHTASLLHDDVIDSAETRRGRSSVNQIFGNKLAILAGDFLLARSSVCLARLRDVEVVELLANVIEHLVKGEVFQMKNLTSREAPFDYYMQKNFYKTGSLMANSCRAAAVLEGHSLETQEIVFDYGRSLGACFQIVDDILDFTSSEEDLGKPVLNDLRQGLSTAPILFAHEQFPKVYELAARSYNEDGDVEEALDYVQRSGGLERTRDLAIQYSNLAVEAALKLEKSEARDGLVKLARAVINQ